MRPQLSRWSIICAAVAIFGTGRMALAQESQKARLRVYLPAPNTRLVIQGVPLKVTDKEVRLFESPPLEPNKTYVYDVKAIWTENDKTITRERSVKVMAGLTTELDLRRANDDSPNIVPPAGGPGSDKSSDNSSDKPTSKPESAEPQTSDTKPTERPTEPEPGRPSETPKSPTADKPAGSTPAQPTTDSKLSGGDTTSKPVSNSPMNKPTENAVPDLSAPLIATPPEIVEFMLTVAKVRDTDVLYDIGCSDGRIALTAVRKFDVRKAVGIDSNPDRIAAAQKAAAGLQGRVEFKRMDLASITENDLADATVVTIDNTSEKQLAELAPVLKRLKVGTRIVTHEFEIPGMRRNDKREKTVDGLDHVIYLYTVR